MKLKTRTNQPVYYKLPVSSNMEELSDTLLNSLKVGDVVQKKTGNQKHCYIVTYKEEQHGICLSYVDCGYMETISYDYTEGHWVYNSKDVCEVPTSDDIKDVVESASSGTIVDVLGLDASGNLVKGTISGGSKMYRHKIDIEVSDATYGTFNMFFILYNNSSTPLNTDALIVSEVSSSVIPMGKNLNLCNSFKKSYGPAYTAVFTLYVSNRSNLAISVIKLDDLSQENISLTSITSYYDDVKEM